MCKSHSWYKKYICIFTIIFNIGVTVAAQKENDNIPLIFADFIEYNAQEQFIYARGNVRVKSEGYFIIASMLLYDIDNDILWVEGDIRIYDQQNHKAFGSTVVFKDKLKTGIIVDFTTRFADNTILAAKLAQKLNDNSALLYKTCFTPCKINDKGKALWLLKAKNTSVDFDKRQITYKNLFFEVYGVPIFYTPYFAHPTPKAPAQSGILVPQIKDSALKIPLYLRAKPNMDFTLTPRLAKNYTIFEAEARHRIHNGDYNILGSYGRIPYNVKKDDKIIHNAKIYRYHLFSSGNFCNDNASYGFDLKRTSDKAYLKNYYGMYDSYLTSKLYFSNIKNNNYLFVEGLNFQGLRANDTKSTEQLIFPKLRTNNVIDLDNEDRRHFIINNDISFYRQFSGSTITRSAVFLVLADHAVTDSGHVINVNLQTRGDAYFINDRPYPEQHKKIIVRAIPEIETIWRYPLFGTTSYNNTFIVEPIVACVLGRNFKHYDKKFALIDANRYELTQHNLFFANHYNGLDYHDFGKRLSYGINSELPIGKNYITIFMGQLLHDGNMSNTENVQHIGYFGINIENSELFYKFWKGKKFTGITDEVGARLHTDKTEFTLSFISIHNLKLYDIMSKPRDVENRVKQMHYSVGYHLTPTWLISGDVQLDIHKSKLHVLYQGIGLTYLEDCVSIGGKLYDDYTYDPARGRKKTRSQTISIGLKVLNM